MRTDGKQKTTKKATVSQTAKPVSSIPRDVQQHCLNVFKDALWTSNEDLNAIQEVKGHLYNRDFAQAFGKPEYLRAYALRWSASRALGYAEIFEKVAKHGLETSRLIVVSLGGGAGAEMVGLAGWMATRESMEVSIRAIDIAEWSSVVEQLHRGVTSPLKLSAYASAAAREKNKPLLSEGFNTTFTQADVLQWSEADAAAAHADVKLITIMFTLNELYSTSVPATQKLLHAITSTAESGTQLLVVDSPGSYSTVSINGSEKKYPMQWLLDHTMLGKDEETAPWVKLVSEESQWFRMPEGLQYPVELENMRYQMHLYQRR